MYHYIYKHVLDSTIPVPEQVLEATGGYNVAGFLSFLESHALGKCFLNSIYSISDRVSGSLL